MHRALAVPEILGLIISAAEGDDSDVLMSTALVSSSWYQPSMKELWRKVSDSDLCSLCTNLLFPQRGEEDLFMPFNERLSRFNMYASLIRELDVRIAVDNFPDETESNEFSPDGQANVRKVFGILQRSAILSRAPYLLPNLKKLQFWLFDSSTLETAAVLLCPSLEEIRISAECDLSFEGPRGFELSLSFILDRISLCPQLRTFVIDMDLSLQAAAMLRLISGCPLLQKMDMEGRSLPPEVFRALSELRHIRSIVLRNYFGWPLRCDGWNISLSDTSFASLESVSIACSCDAAITLLQLIPLSLQEICLNQSEIGAVHQDQVLKLLSMFVPHAGTLRKLLVRLTGILSSPSHPVRFKTLGSVLKCRRLQNLSITVSNSMCLDLDDEDIADLARALPNLTGLELLWSLTGLGGLYRPEALTFKGIGQLSLLCKAIQDISLTSLSPLSLGVQGLHGRRSEIVTLTLQNEDQAAPNPEIIAAFLASLWPNIRLSLSVTQTCSNSRKAVVAILAGIQLGRKMEHSKDISLLACQQMRSSIPGHRITVLE